MSSLPYRARRALAVSRRAGVVDVALWLGSALLMAPACRADFDRFDFSAAAGGAAQGARGGSAGASGASGGARAGAAGDAGDSGMGGTLTTAGSSGAGSGGLVAGSGGTAGVGGADTDAVAGAGGAAGSVSSIGRVECPPGSGVQCGLEEFCCGAQPSGAPVCLPIGEACAPSAALYCDEPGDCAGTSEVCCVSNSTGVTHSECTPEGDCEYPDNRVWCDASDPPSSVDCGAGSSCVASSLDVLGLSFSGAMLATCEPVGGAASGTGGAVGTGNITGMGGITGTSTGGTTAMGGTTGTGFGGTTGTGATGGT